jgi:ATP-dependent DNA helicase RecG
MSKAEIAERLHLRTVSGQLNRTIRSLLIRGLLTRTIPGKPSSRLQKYGLSGAH